MAGATKVLTFAEGTTVSAPSQSFLKASSLETYATTAAYVTAKGSSAAEGDIFANTTTNFINYYDGSGWVALVEDTATQTLTNKTLTSPAINGSNLNFGTASNTNRLLLPNDTTANLDALTDTAALLAYDTTLAKPVYNNGSGWAAIGGGASTGVNHIEGDDYNFETSIGNWTEFDDGAVTIPVDGTGGTASNLTTSRNTTTPLTGTADLKWVMAAANGIGEGTAVAFTVDRGYYANAHTIRFLVDASDANYADDDVIVYIYDVTNSALIQPSNYQIKASSFTQEHVCEFQTSATGASYRLILMQSSTNATGYTLYFTNFRVGPSSAVYASPVTDWESYNPTVTNISTSTNNGYWRRVGDQMEINLYIVTSSAASGTISVDIPSGHTIDYNKLPIGTYANVGFIDMNSAGAHHLGVVLTDNGDANSVVFAGDDGSNLWDATTPVTWASGDIMRITFSVPISGWGSSLKISDSSDSREVYASGAGNGGTVITANTTNIDFTETSDSHASFDGTTFTVPTTGRYLFSGAVYATTSAINGIQAYIDGSADQFLGYEGAASPLTQFNGILELTKGQTVTFRADASFTLSNSTTQHRINIQKMSGNTSIAASDLVAARYSSNAGQSVANNSWVRVNYEDQEKDSHGSVNTGASWVWTCPISGFYSFNASTSITSNTFNGTTEAFGIRAVKNSSTVINQNEREGSGASGDPNICQVVGACDFAKGDTLYFETIQVSGGALNMDTGVGQVVMSIHRVGF